MDKNTRFPYVLETDRVNDKENRPTFYFGALTMRAWRNLNKRAIEIDKCKTVDGALDELCSMISDHLLGWEFMTNPATGKPLKFSKSKLGDLITMDEGWELIRGIKNQGVEASDRKNSLSPSNSNTE